MADGDGGDASAVKAPTQQELKVAAKAAFDLVQRVRMNGAIRMEKALADHFGLGQSTMSLERLRQIDRACRRADVSPGSLYAERGLLYGCSLAETEVGYRVYYRFMCKIADE